MKQMRYIIAILVIVFRLVNIAQASGKRILFLDMGPVGKGPQAEIVIRNNGGDQKEITIDTRRLEPNAVYGVWLVSVESSWIPLTKPTVKKARLGGGDYSFKSDETGNGHYTATILAKEFEKWKELRIVFRPDGDPTNLEKTGISLVVKLK